MNKKKVVKVLIILNILILSTLGYYTFFTNFYHWVEHPVWLNPSEHSYEIKSVIKILTGIGIVFPIIICAVSRKYLWVIQSILIFIIVKNYKKDIVQKTIFINQPTSIYKINLRAENLINQNEKKIQSIIQKVNKKSIDTITNSELKSYTKNEQFDISNIHFKNKKVDYLYILDKDFLKHLNSEYPSYNLIHYPNNHSYQQDSIKKLGTCLLAPHCDGHNYIYFNEKWVIYISDVGCG